MFIPRFQGNAIQDEKGWYWELFVSEFGGGQKAEMFSTIKRFNSKEDALKNLREMIDSIVDHIANSNPELGIEKGKYIDLNSNETIIKNRVTN